MSGVRKLKTKDDTRMNVDGLEYKIQMQRKKEKHLHPIRLDSKTILFVRRKDCNKKHIEEYKRKIESHEGLE